MIGDKIGDQVAAIEMDGGAEKPLGIGYGSMGSPRRPLLREVRLVCLRYPGVRWT